jgi:uncharacterized protein YdhG (YjbR/CyaY superfamily)
MSVASYLQALPRQEKKLLEGMRRLILDLVPEGEERLSRGVPFFYYRGKRVVGLHSTKTHLSFYIMEGKVLKNLQSQLKDFAYSSTVIKFTLENPLPDALIKKLVQARMKEINENMG